MRTIKLSHYKNYGSCIALSNGKFKALITIDFGPRVIYYGTEDGRNVMFEDVDRKIQNSGEYFDRNFQKGASWFLYGGHRLWRAPEDEASYVPDNDPVEYAIGRDCVTFTAPVRQNTKLRFALKAAMDINGSLNLAHIIENHGPVTVRAAAWAVTALKAGGTATIPLNTVNTGYLPNNHISYWPYNDMNDKRLSYADGHIILKHDAAAKKPLKIGTLSRNGVASYNVDGLLFTKRFPYINGVVYPDNNCNFESYVSADLLELESLSPLCEIEPNSSIEHVEQFEISERKKIKPTEASNEKKIKPTEASGEKKLGLQKIL